MRIAERGRAEMRIVERGLRNGKTSLASLFKVRSFQPSNFEYASLGCWPVDRDHSAIRVPQSAFQSLVAVLLVSERPSQARTNSMPGGIIETTMTPRITSEKLCWT
jgi:hypothetical protein